MINNDDEFEIMTWNAHSLRPKRLEFFDYMINNEVSAAAVSETFLCDDDSLYHPLFVVKRLDRPGNTRGGGVAIVLRHDVPYELLPHPNTNVIEAISVRILSDVAPFVFTAVYFPPSDDPNILECYKGDLHLLKSLHPEHVIAGDLNSRHTQWNCVQANSAGRILCDFVETTDVILYHPSTPTHYPENNGTPSTIDLMLVHGTIHLSDPVTYTDLSSDHRPVHCSVLSPMSKRTTTTRILDYDNANWMMYQRIVGRGSRDAPTDLSSPDKIDEAITHISQLMTLAESVAVPTKRIVKSIPKLPAHVRRLKTIRNSLTRRWQRSTNPNERQLYKEARDSISQRIETEINKTINDNFTRSVERINQDSGPFRRKLWKITKHFKSRPANTPPLIKDNRRLVTDNEKCEAFAEHFQQVHDSAVVPQSTRLRRLARQSKSAIKSAINYHSPTLTITDVKNALRLLKNSKASGPDRIGHRLLKKLPDEGVKVLCNIFNACARIGYFPKAWKIATVIAIRKPGKPANQIDSYRPISLLSNIGKLFERLILPHIQCFIDDNNIIKDMQYGFQPSKSCTHQLVRITQIIRRAIRHRQSIGMLAIDLKSAFDTLWHDGLIHKMHLLGFPTFILRLVASFLEDRFFRVKIGSTMSTVRPVKAGTAQGAVWSPSLFNVYVADIPTERDCISAQFADDTAKLSVSHRTSTIHRRLQKSCNRTTKFFERWGIKTNGPKSTAVLFTQKTAERHRPQTKLKVDETEVDWSETLKYLGVHLDKRLRYGKHVEETIAKGNRLMKMLYPLVCRNSPLSLENKLLLFKSVFRPAICYASPVWSHCAVTHLRRLQIFQNKLLKMMMNLHWRTATEDVHLDSGIEMLIPYLERISSQFFDKCRTNINQDIVALADGN